MAKHICHAQCCTRPVPPSMFMCRWHWFMLPTRLRNLVWLHYRAGQEIRKDPTREYLDVTREAVEFVFARENADA